MSEPYPPDIARALAGPDVSNQLGMFGGRLSYHAVVSSTNDVALELGKAGAPAGTSVVASQQSSGRGRRGRSWFSPSNVGVYVSVVLRDVASPLVTLLAGVATAEGIHAADRCTRRARVAKRPRGVLGATGRCLSTRQAGRRADRGGTRSGGTAAGRRGDRRQCTRHGLPERHPGTRLMPGGARGNPGRPGCRARPDPCRVGDLAGPLGA